MRQQLRDSPALQDALQVCLHQLLMQVSQNISCTRFHEIDARLARWLLMTHDRAHADHFHLTHEYLAGMLGVQRGAVSIAAAILKKRRLIDYARGDIRILSRRGLESIACECYRLANPYQLVLPQRP
jgi:CRP-like cAMP-binding protein